MRARHKVRQAVAALNLPPLVLAIFDGEAIDPCLRYRCESPQHWFAGTVDVPGGDVVPLWECGVSVTAYQFAKPAGRFVCFSSESPADVIALGSNFGCVVVDLLVELWEDEVDESALEAVARAFGFQQFQQLLPDLAAAPLTCDEYRGWRAGLRARYGA